MQARSLSCFLFPSEGFFIALPQTVVVEIVRKPELIKIEGFSSWHKGQINWRSESVALVSLDALCAVPTSAQNTSSLVAVLHALQEDSDMRFYGFQLTAIPRSVWLDADSLVEVREKSINCDYISSESLLEGHKVVIPNLKRIESEISRQVAEAGSA